MTFPLPSMLQLTLSQRLRYLQTVKAKISIRLDICSRSLKSAAVGVGRFAGMERKQWERVAESRAE